MTRSRLAILGAVVVVCFATALAYVLHARSSAAVPAEPVTATLGLEQVLAEPHIVFRDTTLGPSYGMVAAVPLAHPGGPRAETTTSCERVYAVAGSGLCVSAKRGVVQTYAVAALDAALAPTVVRPLTGLPSRARISADGSLTATTTFVTGHSYADTSFSTSTVIRRDGQSLGNIEDWTTVLPNGERLTAVDRNFWGVTFGTDDDTFFATAASGGTTWLVRGSLRERRMTALRTDAECPSLSPDGTRVAYKKRLGNPTPGVWKLAVLDLASGRETRLAETRSVDDQLEWLDADHVLYGLPREGSQATVTDVWAVATDGRGSPQILIEGAASPAVIRG